MDVYSVLGFLSELLFIIKYWTCDCPYGSSRWCVKGFLSVSVSSSLSDSLSRP